MNIAAAAASHIAKDLVSIHNIAIHAPGSSHPSLSDGTFNYDWFMGKWGVAWSTLPMWKDKKDVEITYTPLTTSHGHVSFNDLVTYRKRSAAADSSPSTIEGVDTLSSGHSAATFDWRGKRLLKLITSHWEVLGYGEDADRSLQWAVTFFSKTLFTPAGVDIYLRTTPGKAGTGQGSRRAVLETIIAKLGENPNENVRSIARDGFEVPGVV